MVETRCPSSNWFITSCLRRSEDDPTEIFNPFGANGDTCASSIPLSKSENGSIRIGGGIKLLIVDDRNFAKEYLPLLLDEKKELLCHNFVGVIEEGSGLSCCRSPVSMSGAVMDLATNAMCSALFASSSYAISSSGESVANSGRSKKNVDPRPSWEKTPTVPPCNSTKP